MRSPRNKPAIHILPDTNVDLTSRTTQALHDQIAQRAYALYERRGRWDGFDLQDWLTAELEILTEKTIH